MVKRTGSSTEPLGLTVTAWGKEVPLMEDFVGNSVKSCREVVENDNTEFSRNICCFNEGSPCAMVCFLELMVGQVLKLRRGRLEMKNQFHCVVI